MWPDQAVIVLFFPSNLGLVPSHVKYSEPVKMLNKLYLLLQFTLPIWILSFLNALILFNVEDVSFTRVGETRLNAKDV